MITHLRVDVIGDAPIQDNSAADLLYYLDFDQGAPYWTVCSISSGPPIIESSTPETRLRLRHFNCTEIPLSIDTALEDVLEKLENWTSGIREFTPDVPGSVILVLRSNYDVAGRRYVHAGMVCLPAQVGTPIGERTLVQALQQAFVERIVIPRQLDPLDLYALNFEFTKVYNLNLAQDREYCVTDYLRRTSNEPKGVERSRLLLYENLSVVQIAELEERDYFTLQAADGQTYRIHAKNHQNVFLVENGRPTIRYCLVSKDQIPVYDLLLAQKLLLENCPEDFFRIANRFDPDRRLQIPGVRVQEFIGALDQVRAA